MSGIKKIHKHIVIGGVVLLIAAVLWIFVIAVPRR